VRASSSADMYNARLLQQHDEAQCDGAHRDEPQRAARDRKRRKDQARRRAHNTSSYSCRYNYYYYYSSLRVYRATSSFTR
jgi:hypothetical protein